MHERSASFFGERERRRKAGIALDGRRAKRDTAAPTGRRCAHDLAAESRTPPHFAFDLPCVGAGIDRFGFPER
jgi:hypothetical protein